MRQRILFPLLLLTILIGAGYQGNVAQGNRVSLLQVFEVQPSPASPLALEEAITFYFNRRVNCADAEAALSWLPAIDGALTCDEYAISFQPADAYERDTSYTFSLTPPLRAKDGAPLLDPFTATFTTIGHLTVVEAFPGAEGGLVPADSAITVVFDRPVIPLLMSTDADELPHPLALSPSTDGIGEWVNSAVYVFTPSEQLDGSANYTVTVSGDLEAVDGSAMAGAVQWSFKSEAPSITSEAPSITSINPRPTADDLILNPRIQLRFNQAMDRSAIERAFFFRAEPESVAPTITGSFEWAEDGKGFAFTPNERLQYDTKYKAGFPPGSPFSRGGYSWTYRTVPPPAIEWTSPADGKTDVSSGGISLRFASQMNIETLEERISIKPRPDNLTRVYYSYMNHRYDIHFEAQPSTEYTIHIEPGMEDTYGNAITEPLTFNFTTSPLPPTLRMRVPGPVGFYNAYRQPTQLYITHGGVEKVDLALYHVATNEFVKQLSGVPHWDYDRIADPDGAALLRSWTIDAEVEENTTRYDLLQLGNNGPVTANENEPLTPGVYYLKMSSPELDESHQEKTHYLNVSTAVLTVKHTTDRVTVWAVDIDSGAPIAGESISVYNQLGEYEGDAITDGRGIAQLHIWHTHEIFSGLVAVLDSAEHFGIGYSHWSEGMEPRQFDYYVPTFPPEFPDLPVHRSSRLPHGAAGFLPRHRAQQG